MKNLIVGIDIGTTTGIAILDTKGNLLELFSKKHLRLNDLINSVTKFGKPLIIATDVNPPPKKIKRIAEKVGGKLFVPKHSLSIKEKQKLISKLKLSISSKHEEDALASALKAYNYYSKLFKRVEERLRDKNLDNYYESVIERIVRKGGNIKQAIEFLLKPKKRKKEVRAKFAQKPKRRKKVRKIKKVVEVDLKILKEKIRRLESYIELIKKIEKLKRKGYALVINLDKLSTTQLLEIEKYIGFRNLVVFSNDLNKILLVKRFKPLCILSEFIYEFRKDVRIEEMEGEKVVKRKEIKTSC